jgi:oleandomycin transport system permease protein
MSAAVGVAGPVGAGRSPLASLAHTAVLAGRIFVQIRRRPTELLDLSLQPIMFVLLFTYVFGGAIAGSNSDYLQYLLPGIIVQNAIFATLGTAVGLNNDLTKGIFDRLQSLPIARWVPLAGRVIADLLRQLWSLAIVLGVGTLLGFRPTTGPLGIIGAAALILAFTLAFSWLAVLIGVAAADAEKIQVYVFTLMLPLTFLSSVFVRPETMPGWLRVCVEVNPVTLLSDATRGLLVGGEVAGPAMGALAWGVAICAVTAPLALRVLRRRS